MSGKIYRYVVWRNDASCGLDLPGRAGLQADRRRGEARQSRATRRRRGATSKSSPTSSTPPTAPSTTRSRAPTASRHRAAVLPHRHALLRRRGRRRARRSAATTCSTTPSGPAPAAPRSEATPGAPDALLLGGPPDPAPEDPDDPLLYDYSNDSYLEPTPNTDKGLQIRPRRTAAAATTPRPKPPASPRSQVHRWVTDPMPSDFKLTGKVTLEFYTRTLNDALHNGDALRLSLQAPRNRTTRSLG